MPRDPPEQKNRGDFSPLEVEKSRFPAYLFFFVAFFFAVFLAFFLAAMVTHLLSRMMV